jgi:MFS family permease
MSSEIAAGPGATRVRGVAHGSRGAVVAVGAVFAINGLAIGGWAGVLPALRSRLDIDAGTLAVLLFVVGAAAVASMQVGGRMADRVGARRVVLTVLPLMMLGALVLAFATSFPVAVVAGVLLGLGNGATDVAMNALGVAVEKARPMPVMSRFHAFWSIGSFGGAAVVLVSAFAFGDANGSVVLPAMLTVALLGAVGLLVALRWIPETAPVSHTVDGRREPIPRIAWLLGAMAVCFGLMEGTAYDWSSIHMADVAGIDPGAASIAVVTVTLFMVAMRLAGDWAVARFGHRPVVWSGAAAAAVGYAITVLATSVPVLLVGWAFVGFGVAMIAPQVYATSGYLGGGRMLAVVVTFGYAAFLAGPAVLGWLVHTYGVQKAMLLPLALSFVLVVIARWMPAIHRGTSESPTD